VCGGTEKRHVDLSITGIGPSVKPRTFAKRRGRKTG
jgi:hypothetical protein